MQSTISGTPGRAGGNPSLRRQQVRAQPRVMLAGILCLLYLCLGFGRSQLERVDSTDFQSYVPFLDSDFHPRQWDYGGYTAVNTSGWIRLTPDYPGKRGYWSAKKGLRANRWTVEFEFKIKGKPGSLIGDGMAFWFTKERFRLGSVMGRSEKWTGLGLLIDTFDNVKSKGGDPAVIGIINDGQKVYNKDDDGRSVSQGRCSMKLRDRKYKTTAKVDYDRETGLTVSLTNDESQKWKKCFEIGKDDLKAMPSRGYFAFSAETGGLSATHDILSISTFTYQDPKDATGFSQKARNSNQWKNKRKAQNWDEAGTFFSGQGSKTKWFWIMFAFVFIAGGGFIAFRAFSKQDSKRF